jgi:hypothetical protein
MSLRSTTETVAGEILDAWFSASPDHSEDENVDKLKGIDERYRPRMGEAAPVEGEKARN